MAKKMSRRLVALSASAIAAAYLAGYVATQSADAQFNAAGGGGVPALSAPAGAGAGSTIARAAPQAPSIASPGVASRPPAGRSGSATAGGAGTIPGPAPQPSPAASASAAASAPATSVPGATTSGAAAVSTGYRDGNYRGSGTSRRGGVDVAVTIQGGRITDVIFTRVTTQYPVSRIAALPGQVVARQSAQVDRITGATYSVQAFQQAVQQALAQAQNSTAAAGAPSSAAG